MRLKCVAAALALLALCCGAFAQGAADKTIRIIVGYPAGGPGDIMARQVAVDMTQILKQPVIVDNKSGASGNIAADYVAQSAPDGNTLLFAAHTHLVNPILMDKVRYDPIKDFTPVSLVSNFPAVLLTGPQSPYSSVADVVKAARESPGKLSYASAGIGSSGHLGGALFETLSGTRMQHVPFRGNSLAIVDVIGGRVDFMFIPMAGVAQMAAQKQVKVLAVGMASRHPDFVGVPTMVEAGYPAFVDTVAWMGILAPAHTPPAIVERLQNAIHQSLNTPQTRDRVRELGAVAVPDSSAEFREFLEKDTLRWSRLIEVAGVKNKQ